MNDSMIKELEAASLVVLGPPNNVSPEQRRFAEEIFMNFRKLKMPYELCREILETSTLDFVLYESIRLIKSSLMKEWKLLPSDDINSLKQYLFHYVINKPTLATFVREQVIHVLAVMIKRKSIDDHGGDCGLMLDEIESLVINGNLHEQLIGCSLIIALLEEYSRIFQTLDTGLSWSVHYDAEIAFENFCLKRIFKFSINALSELIKNELVEERLRLVKQLIIIAENILVWKFVLNMSRKPVFMTIRSSGATDNPPVRLSGFWVDVILDPMLIQLFFTLYWKIRTNLQIAHHARFCLIQLASLSGTVRINPIQTVQYLSTYIDGFIKLVSNINIIDQEAIGMAQMIQNLLAFFQIYFEEISSELRSSLVDQMTRLTYIFAEGANQEELLYTGDRFYTEAFEIMLKNWLHALEDEYWFPSVLIEQGAIQIFDLCIKCHLSPPDGNRQISDKELTEDVLHTAQYDRVKYKKRLQIFGHIARKVTGYSLKILTQLLESRTAKLRHDLSEISINSKNNSNDIPINIQNLYEDIHWLVLLSGHVLCMETDGEIPSAPNEIATYTNAQKEYGKVNRDMTMQLLMSPQLSFHEICANEESFDPVIRLVSIIFRLCEIEKMAINGNMGYILSSELSGTIVWFLKRWIETYLSKDEKSSDSLPSNYHSMFKPESVEFKWVVDYLLEKIHYSITTFSGEEELMKDNIELLLMLAKFDRAKVILKSNCLRPLIELTMKNHINFPQVAKRGLMRAIVVIGRTLDDTVEDEQYWTLTLQLLVNRLNQIVSLNISNRTVHDENVKIQIIDILDCFIGCVRGIESSTSPSILHYIKPLVFQLSNLISQYCNYEEIVQLILEFIYECSRRMLHYLGEKCDLSDIHQSFILTIKTHVRNINQVSVNIAKDESSYQDIAILMKILNECLEIMARDFTFSSSVKISDMFLTGLTAIIPMITIELLKFSSLCNQYYEMIVFACRICPKKICNLQTDLLQQLMGSVEFGLDSFSLDITENCCHIIKSMADHIYNKVDANQANYELMVPFINLLMNLLISRRINWDLTPSLSAALYNLICCYPKQYEQLVGNFLAGQSDPVVAEKMKLAFMNLTEGVRFICLELRRDLVAFRNNFDIFIVSLLELITV